MRKHRFTLRFPVHTLALATLVLALGFAVGADAQECVDPTPACKEGWTYQNGECVSGPNWLGHRAHCRFVDCGLCSEALLDRDNGVCCAPGGGHGSGDGNACRRADCAEGWTFRDGRCVSGPNWLGHRAHCLLKDCGVCKPDEELDTSTGQCCKVD